MNNTATSPDPTLSEILQWLDDAGLSVSTVQQSACSVCATSAAA